MMFSDVTEDSFEPNHLHLSKPNLPFIHKLRTLSRLQDVTRSHHCPHFFPGCWSVSSLPTTNKDNEKLKPCLPSVGNVSMGGQSEKPQPIDGAAQSNPYSQVLSRASRLKMCPGTETCWVPWKTGPRNPCGTCGSLMGTL